jgi:hypothetical protein
MTEVLTLLPTITGPVGTFALGVVGTVAGPVVSEVEVLLAEITSIVDALLDPVVGVIASL